MANVFLKASFFQYFTICWSLCNNSTFAEDQVFIANCEEGIDYENVDKNIYGKWGTNMKTQKTEHLRIGHEEELHNKLPLREYEYLRK